MASLYKHSRSPFWFVQFIDEKDGQRKNRSTGYRHDSPDETIKARELRAHLEVKELRQSIQVKKDGWKWVKTFFERRCETESTFERYLDGWKWLEFYIQEKRIHSPSQIAYSHAIDYVEWRTTFVKKSGKKAGKNTAIFELKLLSLVMSEAIKLKYCTANPIIKLGIAKDKPKEKRPLTDEEIIISLDALKVEPIWMQRSFKIGLLTGCRLRETIIPTDLINFTNRIVTFDNPKGGGERAFSIPMNEELEAVLRPIVDAGEKVTLTMPFQPSKKWRDFFDNLGMDVCFHCLRVTYITRLLLGGVPPAVSRKLVNHASELIHRIYQKVGVDDVRPYSNVVKFPPVESAAILSIPSKESSH